MRDSERGGSVADIQKENMKERERGGKEGEGRVCWVTERVELG